MLEKELIPNFSQLHIADLDRVMIRKYFSESSRLMTYETTTRDIQNEDNYPIRLVKESDLDKFGEKVIRVKANLYVYLFKKYIITTVSK